MRYDRLTILLARVIADQDDYRYFRKPIFHLFYITQKFLFSYFAVSKDGALQNQQTGIFRTNCVDCLDRTNVVQTLFSKRILEQQLKRYNIIKYNETIDSHKQLSNIFKNGKSRVFLFWMEKMDFLLFSLGG